MHLPTNGFKEALVGRLLTALDGDAAPQEATTELVLGEHHMELPTLPDGAMCVVTSIASTM